MKNSILKISGSMDVKITLKSILGCCSVRGWSRVAGFVSSNKVGNPWFRYSLFILCTDIPLGKSARWVAVNEIHYLCKIIVLSLITNSNFRRNGNQFLAQVYLHSNDCGGFIYGCVFLNHSFFFWPNTPYSLCCNFRIFHGCHGHR